MASVSRDNSDNSGGSLSVSQHQVLFDKQIIKASSPKDDTWSEILIVRGSRAGVGGGVVPLSLSAKRKLSKAAASGDN